MFGVSLKYVFHGDQCETVWRVSRREMNRNGIAFYMQNATCARILPMRRVDSASKIIQIKGEREREMKKGRKREKEGDREKWNWMELHVSLDRACVRTLKRAEKSTRDCFPWSRGDRFIE